MAFNDQRQAASLENQLRSMILSNATNGRGQQQIPHPVHPAINYAPPPGLAPAQRNNVTRNHASTSTHPQHQRPYNGFYSAAPVHDRLPYGTDSQQHRDPAVRREGFRQPVTSPPGIVPSGYHRHAGRVDPDAFQRGSPRGPLSQHQRQQQLYDPLTALAPGHLVGTAHDRQWQYLARVASEQIPRVEMTADELRLKETFRIALEKICQNLSSPDSASPLPAIELHGFGSLSSGFASAGSDMDLAIVTDSSESSEHQFSMHKNSLPRVLEAELLSLGIGARLLTRTRVPIIKVCESPGPELLDALRREREKWDALPDDEKDGADKAPADESSPKIDGGAPTETSETRFNGTPSKSGQHAPVGNPQPADKKTHEQPILNSPTTAAMPLAQSHPVLQPHTNRQRAQKAWTRERIGGPLDFPKEGVGIQCDINFFNPLGIHNTKMLRCYSKCDSRVRPMILFVKAWAKCRKINSSYSGTLSSYGFVLMVLHYLVNIASPPVLPNLQLEAHKAGFPGVEVDGWEVKFFADEDEIVRKAMHGGLTQNHQPVGALLLGFFQYYAQPAGGHGFIWMQDVLSLRTPGGVLKKEEKGWTGARVEKGDNKEVRHRYLFAIEDPFELTHNVARTVTHPGICAIRDEFRRAWRILGAVGRNQNPHDGELFAELQDEIPHDVVPPRDAVQTRAAPPSRREEYSQAFPSLGTPAKVAALPVKQSPNKAVPNGPVIQNSNEAVPDGQVGTTPAQQAKAHPKTFRRGKQLPTGKRNAPKVTGMQ
ncbi:hypothetical protein MBLNU459_g3853t2 [Dothideomycetes sp. NU459]